MRLLAFCNACLRQGHSGRDDGHPSASEAELITVTSGLFTDWTCRNGHTAKYWHGAPFFEHLFAHGVKALAQGDTRASVLNFYSCWDNFVSYVIRVLVDEAGHSASSIPKDYSLAERRVGVFAGLYFGRTSRWPATAGADAASVRNKVIHDDKIPSESEAFKVAEAVQKAVTACKVDLGEDLFQSHATGEKAHARFARDLLAAGIEDAEAANVTAMYEGGSLVHVDVAEFVRRMRAGEVLTEPSNH